MLRDKYDCIVVGGGPTGITAALRVSALGGRAFLVDATPARQFQFSGPTGLYSKALRDASKKIDVRVLRSMGLGDAAIWAQVQEKVSSILVKAGGNNAAAGRGSPPMQQKLRRRAAANRAAAAKAKPPPPAAGPGPAGGARWRGY